MDEFEESEALAYLFTIVIGRVNPTVNKEETYHMLFEFLCTPNGGELTALQLGDKIRATGSAYQGEVRH